MKIVDLDFELFIPADEIDKRVKELAAQLTADYSNSHPVFVGVLNGSFLFTADLIKHIDVPCEISFTKLSSYYGGTSTTNTIRDFTDYITDIKGRDVVVIEDIVDTGNTARYLIDKLMLQQPSSLKLCTLLLKPDALTHQIDELQYVGFEIPNHFVVGYGLDYKEMGRNLKDIYKKV
jgi:hypoxanthine phosphoribosyltransferase